MAMEPAPHVWFKADEVYATIEHDEYPIWGWHVQVWTSPITSYGWYTFTHAGARRSARRRIASIRRGLNRKTKREVIH